MSRPGIHIRLLVAACALICAATFTLDVVGIHMSRKFMATRFKDRMTFLAKYLALNAEVGVLIRDKSTLENLASNLLGEEDVARVVIVDNHGAVLADRENRISGPLSAVETPVVFKKFEGENLLFAPNAGEDTPKVDVIGKVHITYSTRGIDQLMNLMTRRFIFFSIGLAVVAGLVFYR
jgi:hypothetical protein